MGHSKGERITISKRWVVYITALVGCLVVITPAGQRLEQDLGLSALYSLRGPVPPPEQVAVVYIDGNTATQLDLPNDLKDWPRSVHACIVKKLKAAGTIAVVFDIAFLKPKPEQLHSEDICPEIIAGTNADLAFINAIRSFGNVALLEQVHQVQYRTRTSPVSATHTSLPFDGLAEAAVSTAPFVLPESASRIDSFFTYLCSHDRQSVADTCHQWNATLPVVALDIYNTNQSGKQKTVSARQ